MNAKIKYVLINLFSKLTASPVAIFDSLFTVYMNMIFSFQLFLTLHSLEILTLIFVIQPIHFFSRLKGFLYSFHLHWLPTLQPTANLMENPPSLIWLYYMIHHSYTCSTIPPLGTCDHNGLHLQLK